MVAQRWTTQDTKNCSRSVETPSTTIISKHTLETKEIGDTNSLSSIACNIEILKFGRKRGWSHKKTAKRGKKVSKTKERSLDLIEQKKLLPKDLSKEVDRVLESCLIGTRAGNVS